MITIAPIAGSRSVNAAGRPAAPARAARVGVGTALFVGLVLLASLGTLLLTGQPVAAAAPVVAVAVLVLLWKLPLRYVFVLFMELYVVVSIPQKSLPDSAITGLYWKSPVYPLNSFLADNLSTTTGIEALRFSGAELFYVLVLGLIAVRTAAGLRIDVAKRQPAAGVLYAFLVAAFLAVMGLEVWGVARGGDFRQSLWQLRNLMWLPVLTGVFCYCMRDVRDFRFPVIVLTVAAWVKILICVRYLLTITWPAWEAPDTLTSHDDSVLFVTLLVVWFATWLHHPTRRSLVLLSLANSVLLIGLVLNNRRIAFVSLFAGLGLAVMMLRGSTKRRILRSFVFASPLFALYLLMGRTHSTGIFKPAALVMSVTQQKDASSKTRDIENFNLIQTLKPNKLLGSGWGFEYNEVSKAYDISEAFAQYRYIAHNSILWLLSIGGVVGFSLMWMPMVVTIFLAARSYRFARSPYDRTVAVSAIAVMVTYLVQAWGDMGTQGACSTLIVAGAMAAAAKLAHATGAWPSHIRLFGVPRAARRAAVVRPDLPGEQPF